MKKDNTEKLSGTYWVSGNNAARVEVIGPFRDDEFHVTYYRSRGMKERGKGEWSRSMTADEIKEHREWHRM